MELWYGKDDKSVNSLWDQKGSHKGDRVVGVFYGLPSHEESVRKAFIEKLEEVP